MRSWTLLAASGGSYALAYSNMMFHYSRFYGDDATAANKGYRVASYTIELRDTGRYGFELPPAQVSIYITYGLQIDACCGIDAMLFFPQNNFLQSNY